VEFHEGEYGCGLDEKYDVVWDVEYYGVQDDELHGHDEEVNEVLDVDVEGVLHEVNDEAQEYVDYEQLDEEEHADYDVDDGEVLSQLDGAL